MIQYKNDLSNRINQAYKTMSKGQKLLSTYITDHYEKAAFLTAAKLGNEVGVSESTVVRFATQLGYKGYPEFQDALGILVQEKLNSVEKMEMEYGTIEQKKMLHNVLLADQKRIQETEEEMDEQAFEIAVDTILKAKTIYVAGVRFCAPLAEFLGFYLRMLFEDVRILTTNSASEIFEQMYRIGEQDVMIGISFPRYSMRTLKAIEFANARNAKVITLTDCVHSPLNLYSSCNLVAKTNTNSIVESMSAPMSVLNALILALSVKKNQEVEENLNTLEKLWDQYQVDGSDEIDHIEDTLKMRYARVGEIK